MFIRNAWYIAAWADELGEKPLARRICDEPVVLFRDQRAAPPRSSTAAAIARRRCRTARSCRPASSAAITASPSTAAASASRSRGRATFPTARACGATRWSRRTSSSGSGWARRPAPTPALIVDFPYHDDKAHWPNKHDCYPHQGQLHADGRQSHGPDASRLPARQDRGRQSVGACRCRDEDDAHARPASSSRAGCATRCRRRAT